MRSRRYVAKYGAIKFLSCPGRARIVSKFRAVFGTACKTRSPTPPKSDKVKLSAADVEKAFREHAADLNVGESGPGARVIAFDGKGLKGSFDNFNDAKAKQVLSAFAVDTALVLAHIDIDEKSNEIPAVQKLLEELDVAGHIITCDAMHCQKKSSKSRPPRTRI